METLKNTQPKQASKKVYRKPRVVSEKLHVPHLLLVCTGYAGGQCPGGIGCWNEDPDLEC